ncbi:MAG: hypothetical protein D6731_04540 [Planctomycetota bacterium]|nr:MAG: hypothetical protein D6731_04540 [Planctomycetota bacterium]
MSGGEHAPERDGYRYPLYRRNDRRLARDYRGPLYLWDIDNTYLVTEYRGLRDLVRLRFESAQDKRPVPGAVELLAALRKGEEGTSGVRPPIYFVSASPESLRGRLEKRMLLDGVLHDGITFRDLHKLRYLRDIFGFKLIALLLYRLENPPAAREVLFGDDLEHDPYVYPLYAQVCAGELRGDELREELLRRGVRRSASVYAAALAGELPTHDPVEWMVIRRLRRRPAAPDEDPRLVRVDDYAQAAALLRAAGFVSRSGLRAVLRAVRSAGGAADVLAPLRGLEDRLGSLEAVRTEAEPEEDAE